MFKLVALDVDGVITEIKSAWRYVHEKLNLINEAIKNAELYYKGKISYKKWAELDVKLWKGLNYDFLMKIFSNINIRKGCKEMFDFLKSKNVKIIAISGGLTPLLKSLSKKLSFDYFIANELEVKDSKLTGGFKLNVTPTNKGLILLKIISKFGIKPEECIGIGDSEFDISMLKLCGYKIAFNPKNKRLIKISDEVIFSETFFELNERIKKLIS